jgi:hypothetical protein
VGSHLIKELRRAVSRNPDDTPTTIQFEQSGFAYVETGALSGDSVYLDGEAFTLMSGEPLLRDGGGDRNADIGWLHDAWRNSDFAATTRALGTFAAVHFDEASGILTLIADRLGIRPVYFAITEDCIIFASALRILEAMPSVDKTIDLRGAIETIALDYPLADRTQYRGIHTIRDAEVIRFCGREIERSHYWRLSDLPERRKKIDDVAREAHDAFSRAIDRRVGSDKRGVAFLSGGLDSRCVVAELLARGLELHTFNFANEGTQDAVFGDAFARLARTIHTRTSRPDPVRWSTEMARRWAESPHRADRPVERPAIVWSGDGGSVGFGSVGVYPSVIDLLRAGKRSAAVRKYFVEHEISLPLPAFKRTIAFEIRDLLSQGVQEALDEVRTESEPGRELYFFRMLHDQRRHMAQHFEDMDLHRLEFHLPFYDGEVLEVMAAAPADYGPRHRLYHAALRYFPPVVQAVPWQTYPGHEACPVTFDDSGLYQWGNDQRDLTRRRHQRTIVHEAARAIWSPTFPGPLLNRWYLLAGSVLHWLGRGDYSYVLEYADRLDGLWRVSHGRWSFE